MPVQLAIIDPPVNTAVNTTIAPPITVAVENLTGVLLTAATNPVTIAIGANPGSGTLGGTLMATPVNGIATFSDLSISAIANGYTLVATSPGLASATSSSFNITAYPITISVPNSLVGVGSTLPGTFTLSQAAPAGGLTVDLTSSNTSAVTISPASVALTQGQTTGSFTYTGVASGESTLSAAATGYLTATTGLTATSALISLGQLPTVAPGQTSSLALSLGVVAPTGGVTVSFSSSNTAVATVTPSVVVPAGTKLPSTNPQITGVGYGSTTITASAAGFAPDIRTVNVSLTASFPPSTTIPLSTPTPVVLTISAPAPTGGLSFTLSSSNTAVATVPATVAFTAGSTTANVNVTGTGVGSATISASYPGVTTATTTVNVNGATTTGSEATGVGLTTYGSASLSASAPAPITVTITSSNPAVALPSTSATAVGTASITFPNVTSSIPTFYVQGQGVGTSTLTLSAPGYTNSTGTATVIPAGFVIRGSLPITTTSFSGTSGITVDLVLLNTGTPTVSQDCNTSGSCWLSPGTGPFSIPMTSSNTGVGTITTSPLVFASGSNSATTSFRPVAAGTSTITLGVQPAGFTAASNGTFSGTATVTAPNIQISSSTATTGVNLEVPLQFNLGQTPPSGVTITVTSSNPSVAIVSSSGTATGGATATFSGITNTNQLTFYVQGLALGTTTLTISAPGYNSATSTVTVDPSGFVLQISSFTTTPTSGETQIPIYPAILAPGSLTYIAAAELNPGVGTVDVPFTSSNTSVGTILTSPLVFTGGNTVQNATFQPVANGSTNLTIGAAPAGFSTPSQMQQITVTVN